MRSDQIANGPKVLEFENNFADFLGLKFAAATANGTTALHLACLALGLKAGDEVITTPFSFIASANAITYTGAKPVFVDIDESFNLDPDLIEKAITPKTKAILVVHLYGRPAAMVEINKLAKQHHLKVIEDACQAHGATINGRSVGTFSDIACFSFYATKNMTTGEGGMVVGKNKSLLEKVKLLRNHGSKIRYHHELLGYNFRLTDLQAALGVVQLRKLASFNKKRYKNAVYLKLGLQNLTDIELPEISPEYSQHQFTIRVKPPLKRDLLKLSLEKSGIETGVFYPVPIHKQPVYADATNNLSLKKAEKAAEEVLSLPVHPGLTKKDLDTIIGGIKKYV